MFFNQTYTKIDEGQEKIVLVICYENNKKSRNN